MNCLSALDPRLWIVIVSCSVAADSSTSKRSLAKDLEEGIPDILSDLQIQSFPLRAVPDIERSVRTQLRIS